MISKIYKGFKVFNNTVNLNNYDNIDPNLIRYFRTEFGKDWEHALTQYISKKNNKDDKKAA